MKTIHKKIILAVLAAILIVLAPSAINAISLQINSRILDELSGSIFYTASVDECWNLYKSDAGLKNKKLIYSNKTKGYLNPNISNDNIGDFRFFPETGIIEFEAVYEGKWAILSIKEGESQPKYVRAPKEVKTLEDYRIVTIDTDYVQNRKNHIEIYEKKGSLYLNKDGQEKCIKRFIGAYSEKFTGYRSVGLSPDGKYLIYSYLGAFLGTTIHERKYYIMDLETEKSAMYAHLSPYVQWVAE